MDNCNFRMKRFCINIDSGNLFHVFRFVVRLMEKVGIFSLKDSEVKVQQSRQGDEHDLYLGEPKCPTQADASLFPVPMFISRLNLSKIRLLISVKFNTLSDFAANNRDLELIKLYEQITKYTFLLEMKDTPLALGTLKGPLVQDIAVDHEFMPRGADDLTNSIVGEISRELWGVTLRSVSVCILL